MKTKNSIAGYRGKYRLRWLARSDGWLRIGLTVTRRGRNG